MALDVVCTGWRRYARVGIRDRLGRSRARAMACWLEDFEKLGCFHRRAKDHAPKGKVDFEDYRHLISPVSSTTDRRNVHLPADHVWALSRCSLLLTLLISVTQNKTRRHEPAGFKKTCAHWAQTGRGPEARKRPGPGRKPTGVDIARTIRLSDAGGRAKTSPHQSAAAISRGSSRSAEKEELTR
jgi:hypothetical protein